MTTVKVQTRFLRPGDVTAGTGETIVSISAGVHTPQGKMDVVLEKDGTTRVACWRSYTLINIKEGTNQ